MGRALVTVQDVPALLKSSDLGSKIASPEATSVIKMQIANVSMPPWVIAPLAHFRKGL